MIVGLTLIGGYACYQYTEVNSGNEKVDVDLLSDGKVTDTVDARTAITLTEKYTGLSDEESLDDGQAMIFIYAEQRERTFVMRNMSFGLDIIFIDGDCSISSIKHAEQPSINQSGIEPMNQYNGTGQYILEVPYNYTEGKISEGDSVDFRRC